MRASEGPPSGFDVKRHMLVWNIVERLAHLLHRAMSDTGGAMLDYDFEYFLLHYAIIYLIPFTSVFGTTRIIQSAQKSASYCRWNTRAGEVIQATLSLT